MDGQTLEEAWPGISDEEKVGIAEEVAGVVKKMQSVTSNVIQSVDGSPCYPGLLFFDLEPRGPFYSDTDLWNALSSTLHDPPAKSFPGQALQTLKNRFPKCEPYVLTHCDLNVSNIMVKGGKLVGILDWEYAAYYPVWDEYISASWGFTEIDAEWKGLLRGRLEGYEDAKGFLRDLFHLREYPDLDERGREVLGRLCSQ